MSPAAPGPAGNSPPEAAVHCRQLGRRFLRHWALAHLDLDLAAARATVIAGANGSGKTTLLRCCAGLCRPTLGELRIHGVDPAAHPRRARQQISLVSHRGFLYPGMTARETAALWLNLLGASTTGVPELLDEVGLGEAADKDVAGFSQGMRKRLSLLRAQIENPRVVLLDEPFAALDPAGQQLVCEWIERFVAEGRTVIFASHAIDRSAEIAHDAVLLHRGQKVWQGEADQLPDAVSRLAERIAPRQDPAEAGAEGTRV